MNDELFIGKSDYNRNGGSGANGTWFYLKDNTDNVYRVLPPLFKLATSGQYSKWFAVHRGLRGTNNKQYPFLCTEEIDRKSKVITRQCAICNKRRDMEAKLEVIKQSGGSKEQINEFNMSQVFPYIAERKYYINVVNQENKIGQLSIGSKMHTAFEALCKQWESKGYDLTGMTGLFVNFKVSKKFKGDKEAVHSTEIYMKGAADGSFRPVTHEITADTIARLKQEAADLTTLFKELTPEQMGLLATSTPQQRAVAIDTIFAAGDKKSAAAPTTALNAQVPGTGATLVGRTEIDGANVSVQMPAQPAPAPAAVPNQNNGNFQSLNNVQTLQTQGLPQQSGGGTAAPTAANLPGARPNQLSDEDFYAMMGVGKK
jgi:hypothetical protein